MPDSHAPAAARPRCPAHHSPRLATQPTDERGYPVPWFVAWVNGAPDFRFIDPAKVVRAVRKRLCFTCGFPLVGASCTFVVGPMCAVNRISAEPPSHRDCAEFAVRACPFLTHPSARRREARMPVGVEDAPGTMLKRNPGVVLLWETDGYTVVPVDTGGHLFHMRPAREVRCVAEGRVATADEIRESVVTGLPLLRAEAEKDGPAAVVELAAMVIEAAKLLGIGEVHCG